MAAQSLKVTGLKELNKALKDAEKATQKEVRARYKEVGEIVRRPAAQMFGRIDAGSAAGFRVAVRQKGVSVEQGRRKVTGLRPDYGRLQMNVALLPALEASADRVVREFEKAVDDIAKIVEG